MCGGGGASRINKKLKSQTKSVSGMWVRNGRVWGFEFARGRLGRVELTEGPRSQNCWTNVVSLCYSLRFAGFPGDMGRCDCHGMIIRVGYQLHISRRMEHELFFVKLWMLIAPWLSKNFKKRQTASIEFMVCLHAISYVLDARFAKAFSPLEVY